MLNISRAVPAVLSSLLLLAACDEPTSADTGIPNTPAGLSRQYGTALTVGNGKARAYVVTDSRNSNTPVEIGVAIDSAAMEGLPATMSMAHLPLPANAPAPYTFVMLDWNPQGHEPGPAYGVPHFDFHFYTTPEADVMAIVPGTPAWVSGANAWPADVPAYYAPPTPPGQAHNGAVPQMGLHWVDIRSPELQTVLPNPPAVPANYKPFTTTFIYGSWNGRFTFLEPMITRQYLLTRPNDDIAIPSPANPAVSFGKNGWYPSRYKISYDTQAKEYRIALSALALKQQ